jgi:hypothetical protein
MLNVSVKANVSGHVGCCASGVMHYATLYTGGLDVVKREA